MAYRIDSKLFGHIMRRRVQLKNIQNRVVPKYKELRDFIYPFVGRFDGEKPNKTEANLDKQLTSVTNRCVATLRAGMQAGLTSESRDWFKLVPEDKGFEDDFELREWCSEVHDRMLRIFSASNFYAETKKVYGELAIYGTGCLLVLEDFENVVRFKSLTAGTYYLGLGKQDTVDTLYRDFYMTAEQLVQEFGRDNVTEQVRRELEEDPDHEHKVHHVIEPDETPGAHWPWRSVYWMDGADPGYVLRVGGYKSFPVMCPRWEVLEGNIYGIGPGHVALGDAKQVQLMTRDLNIAIKKEIDPPLIAASSLASSNVRTTPKGITWVNEQDVSGGRLISPVYSVTANLEHLSNVISEKKRDIKEAFYEDLFLMIHNSDDKDKTATEIQSLEIEKAMVLGPVLESLITEFLTPIIYRVFDRMADCGLLPDIPESISGVNLKPEYISILAQAQKLKSIQPIEQTLAYVGGVVQMQPDVLDLIDFDEAIRKYGESVGVPAGIMRAPNDVEKIRAQRAEAQAQQEQAAQLQAAAEQMPNIAQGAKLMSEIDQGGNSALEALGGVV